jgi:hydroxymethylpyrimidine pyrophosphatase-like HAD family hydrolase
MEFSLPIFLEIYNSKVSKGDALHKLCEILDLQRNEIVAVGDGENDLSMIQYAGLGVAMENATDILKKEANYITLSNDNNGISHVIQKFWNL